MNTLQKEYHLADQTWDLCQQRLKPPIRGSLSKHLSDPRPLDKRGHKNFVAQLRILPANPKPPFFWDSNWCFYQILVGSIDQSLGGIQFLQFSDNSKCGSGKWHDAVEKALLALQAKRPDFLFTGVSSGGARKPQLYTRYRIGPH